MISFAWLDQLQDPAPAVVTHAVSPIWVVRNSPGVPKNGDEGAAKYGSYPVTLPTVWLFTLIKTQSMVLPVIP
jgi:hypothetical protein